MADLDPNSAPTEIVSKIENQDKEKNKGFVENRSLNGVRDKIC